MSAKSRGRGRLDHPLFPEGVRGDQYDHVNIHGEPLVASLADGRESVGLDLQLFPKGVQAGQYDRVKIRGAPQEASLADSLVSVWPIIHF